MTNFFHYLWKRRNGQPEHEDRGIEVRIPHTICYEHNFPKGWYSTTSNGITRRTGKDIDTKAVREAFGKTRITDEDSPVALYIEPKPGANGGFSLEFFDRGRLREFLAGGTRGAGRSGTGEETSVEVHPKNGVLQQFVHPGGNHNHMIQAVWSRHLCHIEKRVNVHPLDPRDRAGRSRGGTPMSKQINIWERVVTYQGPAALSQQAFCAPNVEESIKQVCNHIVEHLQQLEHATVERMVMYFKTDPEQNLWLMWCSYCRLKRGPEAASPRNLVPRFTLVERRGLEKALSYLSDDDRLRLIAPPPSIGQFSLADASRTILPTWSRLHRRPNTAPRSGIALVSAGLHGNESPRRFMPLEQVLRDDLAVAPPRSRPASAADSNRPAIQGGKGKVPVTEQSQKPLQRRRLYKVTEKIGTARKLGPGSVVIAVNANREKEGQGGLLAPPPPELRTAAGDDLGHVVRRLADDPLLRHLADSVTPQLRAKAVAIAEATEAAVDWLEGLVYVSYSHFLQSPAAAPFRSPPPEEAISAFPELRCATAALPFACGGTSMSRSSILSVFRARDSSTHVDDDSDSGLISQGVPIFTKKPHLLKLKAEADVIKRSVIGEAVVSVRAQVVRCALTMPAAVVSGLVILAVEGAEQYFLAEAAARRARHRPPIGKRFRGLL